MCSLFSTGKDNKDHKAIVPTNS